LAEWREVVARVIRERFTPADVQAMLEAMQAAGLAGDVQAAALWLDRVLGKMDAKVTVDVNTVPANELRSAIETLTRLGLADRLPPSLAVVAESPALPSTMPQDQSVGDGSGNATNNQRIDPEPS
jgi:hypothetical protein